MLRRDAHPGDETMYGKFGLARAAGDVIDDFVSGFVGKPRLWSEFPKISFWLDMFFHQFGDDFVLALKLLFQGLDGPKVSVAVLEECFCQAYRRTWATVGAGRRGLKRGCDR